MHQLAIDQADGRGVMVVAQGKHRLGERPLPREGRSQRLVAEPVVSESAEHRLVGQVLGIVAVLALSFLLELTVLGGLRHDRDQAGLAALFRLELAQGKDGQGHDLLAPVGPLDETGKPLPAGAPVALLEIPRLGLREVVVEGTASGTLMSGPGHRRDTPLPGQAGTSVIAGRRATYGGPFGSLSELRAGDPITVTTGQGKSSFIVLGVRRVGDRVPPPLAQGHGRLTLVTTDGPRYSPTDALRVDANLVSETQPRPAQLPSQALPPAEALMAGDPSALWGLVGWSALLVAAAIAMVWVRFRTGFWQAWVMGLPVLVTFGLFAADEIAALLPNLL